MLGALQPVSVQHTQALHGQQDSAPSPQEDVPEPTRWVRRRSLATPDDGTPPDNERALHCRSGRRRGQRGGYVANEATNTSKSTRLCLRRAGRNQRNPNFSRSSPGNGRKSSASTSSGIDASSSADGKRFKPMRGSASAHSLWLVW